MLSVSTSLPATPAFSALLDIRGLQPSSVLCKLSENLGPSDQVNVYGTLDSTATSTSANITLLGSVYGNQGDTATPLTTSFWPFVIAQRVTGSATGTLFVSGSTAAGTTTAPTSTALPAINTFSAAINLSSFGSGLPVRVGLDKSSTLSDVFNVYGTNDPAFVGTAGGELINQISGGGSNSRGSVLIQNFQYVYVQRVGGATAGNLLAWGADDATGGGGGSAWDQGGNSFGAPGVFGTNDTNGISFKAAGNGNFLTVDTSGDVVLGAIGVAGALTTVTGPSSVVVSVPNATSGTATGTIYVLAGGAPLPSSVPNTRNFLVVDTIGNIIIGGASATGVSIGNLNAPVLLNGVLTQNFVAISNIAGGGVIGTAAATVNVSSWFVVDQTTAGQALTLPNPTGNANAYGKRATVQNNGTASFTMYGATVAASATNSVSAIDLAWDATNSRWTLFAT